MYLIILGSDEEPPASKVTEEDKDDWRLARGKVILREAWRLGQGYVYRLSLLNKNDRMSIRDLGSDES